MVSPHVIFKVESLELEAERGVVWSCSRPCAADGGVGISDWPGVQRSSSDCLKVLHRLLIQSSLT